MPGRKSRRLWLIVLALAVLIGGHQLGKHYQRQQYAAAGIELPERPLPTAIGTVDPALARALDGHWNLLLAGEPGPACDALARRWLETFNRLADLQRVQPRLRLVLLAARDTGGGALWTDLPPLRLHRPSTAQRARLLQNLELPEPGARACRGEAAVTALIGPDGRRYARLRLDKPARMAESLRLLFQDLEDMRTDSEPGTGDRIKTALLRVLPQHLLSRAMYHLARSEIVWLKNFMIRQVVTRYDVDMRDARVEDPYAYPSFNAFFTRALKPEARPVTREGLASPVDARVSQYGRIRHDRLLQAKGHEYSLYALLAGDGERAGQFESGTFFTLYLAPRDYHRIHMPIDGILREMVFVPGDLFSVSEATAQLVPGLFARNERVILHFDTARGPMALVLVGAIFVGSMETVWHGEVRGVDGGIARWHYEGDTAPRFARGEEIARFNLGSTVIVLNPQHAVDPLDGLLGRAVRMGEKIAD